MILFMCVGINQVAYLNAIGAPAAVHGASLAFAAIVQLFLSAALVANK